MFARDIGIDLGTANTVIYMKNKGIVLREPSVVAVNTVTHRAEAAGSEAKRMIGRTPGSIAAVRPLRDGVIADLDLTAAMLAGFMRRVIRPRGFCRPKTVICIPSGCTDVERRAVEEAVRAAGAGQTELIEEPMAAAVGAGLPVDQPKGSMVADIGGGTAEVAVISLNDIVTARSVRAAGDRFDEAIMNYVRKKFGLLIGEPTAEEIKLRIGSAYPYEDEGSMRIKGCGIADGLPKEAEISAAEVREALTEPLGLITDAIKTALEQAPPELSADVMESGIMLTGGGALLRGIDLLTAKETGLPVHIADAPLDCVAEGAGKRLEQR